MITVKSTSGAYTIGSFLPKALTADDVLADARTTWPHATLDYVSDAGTGLTYRPDEVVPDGATVHVLSQQPVDA